MKLLKHICMIAALFGGATALGASASEVEVVFAQRIQNNLSRIDQMEKKREAFFRENRVEGANRRPNSRLNVGRFANAEFATERLIPNVEDFSVTALVKAMAAYNLGKVAAHNPDHKLVVEINEFYASNYSLAPFTSFNTRMQGSVSLVDASGTVINRQDVTTALVPQWTGSWSYKGTEHAFLDESMDVRFAPILANFLKKGIEKLYPGADVPGPIFLRE